MNPVSLPASSKQSRGLSALIVSKARGRHGDVLSSEKSICRILCSFTRNTPPFEYRFLAFDLSVCPPYHLASIPKPLNRFSCNFIGRLSLKLKTIWQFSFSAILTYNKIHNWTILRILYHKQFL